MSVLGKTETVEKTDNGKAEEAKEQELESTETMKIAKTMKFGEVEQEMKIDSRFLSWGVGETIKVRFLVEKPVYKIEGESKKKTLFWKYGYPVFDLDTQTEKILVLWESHIRKIEPYWKEQKYSLKMTKLEKDISPIIPL